MDTAPFPVLTADQVDAATRHNGLVLLDFWQESCPPCRALRPRLDAFAARHRGAFTGYRIDIDADQTTPARYGVMSIPTLILLRDGHEIARRDGLIRDSDLETLLTEATPAEKHSTRREG